MTPILGDDESFTVVAIPGFVLDRRTLILGAAAAVFVSRASPVLAGPVTHLRIANDRIFLPASIDGVAVEALLDSAAEASIVDRAFAARIGLRGGETVTAHGTGAATADATLVPGVELFVAGVRLRPKVVAAIDLGDISRRLGGRPIELIIGRDLFDAARLAIDFTHATLRVVDRASRPPGVRLPLTMRRGVETLPVTIEGVLAQADLDLGNGGTVLVGMAFASRRLLDDGRATAVIPGGGIGGATVQRALVLRTLDIAGRRFADVPAAIDASPTAADANIGVRLLRRFGLVTDFAERGVWLDFRG